ncbi:RuvX/YqgF family protein [Bacteroidota bacterium]
MPLKVFDPGSSGFWDELINIINKENVRAVVVGIPYRHDDKTTELIEEIEGFIDKLKEKSRLDIYTYDEAFSTHRAVDTMLQIGKKKRQRARKGSKDLIAAAIILRDFLEELE